jgi:type II secretory pathway component PulF
MPQFRYTARNSTGQLVDGTVTASDRSGAIAQVEQQRYIPIKIQMVADPGAAPLSAAAVANAKPAQKALPPPKETSPTTAKSEGGKPVVQGSKALAKPGATPPAPPVKVTSLSHSQQYLFTEQLAHLLGAGMTLDESLGVLVKRLKQPKLRAVSQSLHQSLIDGRSLSQAMKDFPRIFTPLYVNMVSAGEASGSLTTILRRLTGYLAEVKSLRDRVQQALMYPAFLVLIGFGLIVVFMRTMVPQLMSFFGDTGAKLPAATQAIINVNNFITSYWWLVIGLLFGMFALFRLFVASPAGRMAWHRSKWSIPVFSRIPRYRFYAQFARTLGTLTENGVTLLRALELLEDITGNVFIAARMREIRAAVVDGATLSGAVSNRGIFPEMFVDMMGVGEQTGKFPETMGLIADVYERELDKQVKVVSTLIPPMVMVLIAAVIGTVIYGILVAVFNLTGGLGRTR